MLSLTDVDLLDFHILSGSHVMWLLRYLKRLVIVRIPTDLRRGGNLLLAQEVGGLGAYLLDHPVVVVGESMGCQHLGLLQTSL